MKIDDLFHSLYFHKRWSSNKWAWQSFVLSTERRRPKGRLYCLCTFNAATTRPSLGLADEVAN